MINWWISQKRIRDFFRTKNTKMTNLFDCNSDAFLKLVSIVVMSLRRTLFDAFILKRSLMLLSQTDAAWLLADMTICYDRSLNDAIICYEIIAICIMWVIKWLYCYYLEDRVRDMNLTARLCESASFYWSRYHQFNSMCRFIVTNDDNDARIERERSKRMIQKKFYSYIIQIRHFDFCTFRNEVRFLFRLTFFLRKLCQMFCFLHISEKMRRLFSFSHSSNREIFNDDELLFVLWVSTTYFWHDSTRYWSFYHDVSLAYV